MLRLVSPIGHVVHGQPHRHDREHGPLGGHLDTERHEGGHRAHPRLRKPHEARRFASQPVGRQGRRRFPVEVEPHGGPEPQPRPGRPRGKLDAPRAHQLVEDEACQGEQVRDQSEQSPSG